MDITKLTGFTPGPWIEADHFTSGTPHLPLVTAMQADIATASVTGTRKEQIANMKLCAAAPDLLVLAKLGLELAKNHGLLDDVANQLTELADRYGEDNARVRGEELAIIAQQARALLARAQGGE